jgi:hypothetical protein
VTDVLWRHHQQCKLAAAAGKRHHIAAQGRSSRRAGRFGTEECDRARLV